MELKEKIRKLEEMNANQDEHIMDYLAEVSKSCKTDEEKALLQEYANKLVADVTVQMDKLEANIEEFKIKEKLGDLTEAINFSYIARKYFGKSKHWLYQRINGYKVNGKVAQFTSEEKEKFNAALSDISSKIKLFTT